MAPRYVEPDDAFPTKQIIVLALCRIAEPIAFTSILAYTYVMVIELHGGDDTNASFYAGLLVSAFAAAEACTAMIWGIISDRYGRKPIILIGLAGTGLSSLIFGFAKNYWTAFAARVVGGLLNGNVAVMQTMVAELVKRPEHEPKAYAVNPFMWSLGSIVGAAMGGFLAQPVKYYPSLFSKDGLFGKFPYLLPNLVATVAIFLAIAQGYFLMEETNPRLRIKVTDDSNATADERTPLQPNPRRMSAVDTYNVGPRRLSIVVGSSPTTTDTSFDLRKSSVGTMHQIEIFSQNQRARDREESLPPLPKAFNSNVILLIVALIIMSYHQMGFASLLPIYLLDEPTKQSGGLDFTGGLGYSVHDVGVYMSVNGIAAMLVQALIFPTFVQKVGVFKSVVTITLLYPCSYIVMPFLSLLPKGSTPLSIGIYITLLFQNFLNIIYYPCILILLKNATPSSLVLGRVNGLAMSSGSGARTISPPLVGIIYSAAGSAVAWWSCAVFALVAIAELYWLPYEKLRVVVENPLSRRMATEANVGQTEEENSV